MRNVLFILLLTACSISISYSDTASDYAKAQQFIANNNLKNKISQSIDSAPILKTIEPNTAAKQAQVQNMESMQNNPGAMASVGSSTATSQMIKNDMLNQPKINIDPNSSTIKNSQTVQDNAVGIASGTYRGCSTKLFNHGSGLVCGGHIFCLDGKCQNITRTKNKKFGKAATQLSAVSSAGSDVAKQNSNPLINPHNIRIFSGKQAFCRDIVLGVMNCCRDTGWAKGIITNCTNRENELGQAKQKGGVVVYVGRYCSNSFLGICLEHKKSYCQFPSRMAADVQISGRRQFGQNFGSPKYPNCSGFMPKDIQNIDFSKIDFTNVISQTENNINIPNNESNQSKISKEINKRMHGGG